MAMAPSYCSFSDSSKPWSRKTSPWLGPVEVAAEGVGDGLGGISNGETDKAIYDSIAMHLKAIWSFDITLVVAGKLLEAASHQWMVVAIVELCPLSRAWSDLVS